MKTALQHVDRGRLQAQLQDSFLQDPAATLCTSHHLTASTGRNSHAPVLGQLAFPGSTALPSTKPQCPECFPNSEGEKVMTNSPLPYIVPLV